MQKDHLEQFIQDNRAEFDDARPSLKLWANIERELGVETPIVKTRQVKMAWYKVAAAALVLLTVGGMGGLYVGQSSSPATVQAIIDKIAPDFQEMEQYYNQQIDQKYGQLTNFVQDPQIDADLAQIDEAMAELRAELEHSPKGTEQQLVEELIASYRLKLQILERVLNSLEQDTDNAGESTGKTSNNSNNETSI